MASSQPPAGPMMHSMPMPSAMPAGMSLPGYPPFPMPGMYGFPGMPTGQPTLSAPPAPAQLDPSAASLHSTTEGIHPERLALLQAREEESGTFAETLVLFVTIADAHVLAKRLYDSEEDQESRKRSRAMHY